MKNLGIRARVVLLVVLCAIPAFAVTLYGAFDERARFVANAHSHIQELAKLAAQHQAQIIEGARQSLVAISLIPDSVRNDAARCNAYLATLLSKSAGLYHSMGIYGEDSVLQCNAIPWQGKVSSPDRLYVRLPFTTGKFTIGEYQVGRVTKQQGINLGYPITDANGKVSGVAFIAIDLGALNRVAAATPLPEQGLVAVVDHAGILLARYPQSAGRVGEKMPIQHIMESVLAAREGTFEAKGFGGLDRLIAFNTVAVNPDGSVAMRVVVSVPLSVVLGAANQAMMRDLAGTLIATVLLLAGAWFGTDVFVVRNLRKLLDVARRVRGGDLTARTGLEAGGEEISHLGRAIDEMAQSLQDRDAQLRHAMTALQEEAITDPLTGLYNRRYLWDFLQRELLLARRAGTPVAAMLLDIDHFKHFNDNWGHDAGDVVLKRVAEVVRTGVRGSDIACRYGGEEMIVILVNATAQIAVERAEAARTSIEAMHVDYAGKPLGVVTASFGVAVFPEHGSDAEELVLAADKAMYEAKNAGRNRVRLSSSEQAPASAA